MAAKKVGIVDLGVSNITSVANAFLKAGSDCSVITTAAQMDKIDIAVLPGVGNYDYLAPKLEASAVKDKIIAHQKSGKPLIGICLGMQILFEGSDEGCSPGLGLLPGRIRKLPSAPPGGGSRKVPNIGYSFSAISSPSRSARVEQLSRLSDYYYFLHSYALSAEEISDGAQLLGSTKFDNITICSMFLVENICGLQFHPERSGSAGLRLLSALVRSI